MTTTNLSPTTLNAIANMKAFKKAYGTARKAAICGAITDALGDEWTAKQFNAHSWALDGIDMPLLDTLLGYGWLSRRMEEFELPMCVKKRIADATAEITLDNGLTFTVKDWQVRHYYLGGEVRQYGGTIVKIEHGPMPEFKGHRYVYSLA